MSLFRRLFRKEPPGAESDEHLEAALFDFLKAPSWLDAQSMLEGQPALLNPQTLGMLAELAAQARQRNDAAALRIFEENLRLLHRCQDVGIEQAFTEKLGKAAQSPLAASQIYSGSESDLASHQAPTRRIVPADLTPEKPAPTSAMAPDVAPAEVGTKRASSRKATRKIVEETLRIEADEEAAMAQEPTTKWEATLPSPSGMAEPPPMATTRRIQMSDGAPQVQAIRQALSQVNRKSQSEYWAALQVELACALVGAGSAGLPLGKTESLAKVDQHPDLLSWQFTRDRRFVHPQRMEEAIVCFYHALDVIKERKHPRQWAAIQNNLAVLLCERQDGDRSANVEQSLHHAEQALRIYTLQKYPEGWAGATFNLAAAYFDRLAGNKAQNLSRAIELWQNTLHIYNQTSHPDQWAQVQFNLGEAYANRMTMMKGASFQLDLEMAMECYQAALQGITRQEKPETWADLQLHLGDLLRQRENGDQVDNLEQAIECYLKALQGYPRHENAEQWAEVQLRLGAVFRQRLMGEREANRSRALHHYERALEIFTASTHPQRWDYIQRMIGEMGENREN